MEYLYLINGRLYTFRPIYNTDIVKVNGSKVVKTMSIYNYAILTTHPESTFIGVL